MRRPFFSIATLATVLLLPLVAHADAIDDFVLTGGGQTISYSLPATSSFPDFPLFNFFSESAPTTVNGVSVGSVTSLYYIIGVFFPTMVIDIADTAGDPELNLDGPQFYTASSVPASNPYPYLPFDVVVTFTPGTYQLENYGYAYNPLPSPIPYTLTITPQTATATTPEPSSLALLATGVFGLVGFAAIKHRRIEPTHWKSA